MRQMRTSGGATATTTVVLVALVMVTSMIALPVLGTGLAGADADEADESGADVANTGESTGLPGDDVELVGMADPTETATELEPLDAAGPVQDADAQPAITQDQDQDHETAVEDGVDEGIELVQAQGVEVTQEQRAAAIEAASASVSQHQEADVEQVQEATMGAVHGTLIQEQRVNATQVQHAVAGATDGALAQHQTATASQLQSATWGATHGAIAQEQRVTVEQIQVATYGAAAGAASSAGEHEIDEQPVIQEAAQGAAYGSLSQYQQLTVEQRQEVSLEHVQHAAAGAAAGTLEGSADVALEQDQQVEGEQRQAVTIKEVQTAAKGAAKGALVQRQTVTVEQTQAAARGAGAGALKQVQSIDIEQVQHVTTPKIEEAASGAATGAITQSQEATVEQIQAAADGGAQGVLVQQQEVSVTQIQSAATGASKGAVESAVQYQVVEVEQIQAVARGAGEGAVLQRQVVDVAQVQSLAAGSAQGALTQHQEATVTQLQVAATSAGQETARAIQYQRISVTQLQLLTAETAADATSYAVQEGIDDQAQLVQYVEIELVQRIEQIDELEGTATLSFPAQNTTGETVAVDDVSLSEGGFVAIYADTTADPDPGDVIGVSPYLEPGEHGDLEIELDEPLEEDRPLVAVAHHDTTDDETFRYAERDGGDDEPYVTEGGAPVLDMAFVTVTDDPDEREGTLSVSDQTGDGDSLLVDEANASVDYVVSTTYEDERVDSDTIDAGESVSEFDLELDPPLEEDSSVAVSVRAADDDDELASETVEFTIDDPFDPDSTLSVSDQTGDGDSLTVDEAGAAVDYALTVSDETGTQLTETEPFAGNETLENETIDFETPLESSSLLEVSLVAVDENQTLETESLEYTVDEEFDASFVDCTRAEVTGSFEDGETVAASTGFYASGGFGNTIAEDFVTIGEDVEAPFTGTIVFEIGAEDDVDDDEITVGVSDYGTFGTYISGISSPEAVPFASVDHPNPQAQECDEEARPDEPSIFVEETSVGADAAVDVGEVGDENEDQNGIGDWQWGNDTIDVTFGYENPNEAELPAISEFVEGATDDEPVDALEPGENEFTVEWTPESEDEQLVWQVGLSHFGYEEPLTAETETAGELVPEPDEPPEFAVEILDANSPVEQGEPLEVAAAVENVGGEADEQAIELALDDEDVNSTAVSLDPDDSEEVTLSAETVELEPGEYTATVASENETAETTVTIEEPADPAEFAVEIADTNSPVEQGEPLEVAAAVENVGDEAGEQAIELDVDGVATDSTSIALEPNASETVTLTADTDDLEPGEYTATVTSENESAETAVTVEEPADPAEFSFVDLSAPPTAVAGQDVTVAATIANTGELAGSQDVVYSVDGEEIAAETVELEVGETEILTFSSTLPEGESTHTVATEDAEESVTIEGLAVPADEPPVEEPADEPPAEDPNGEPPAEEPNGEPPVEAPNGDPPAEEPDDEPPAEEPDDEPPAEEPNDGSPPDTEPTDTPTDTGPESADDPAVQQGDAANESAAGSA